MAANDPVRAILNAFSIDVEGFVESNLQSFPIAPEYIDRAAENIEISRNVDALLEVLDGANTKATFFFVGRLARDIPESVKKVAAAGHEIGCHSYEHIRVYGVKPEEFREKLSAAKNLIEDVAGRKVYGFRAPDFSITSASLWALDILRDLGFVYDTSIYPFGLHDVYGIKNATSTIHKLPNGLVEFPMSTVEVFGKRLPFGGGGYFRLYPLFITRRCVSRLNKQNIPAMFYIHPYEVGPAIPKIRGLGAYRTFRHYYHCSSGGSRMSKILRTVKFGPVIDVLKSQGYL